MANGWSGQKMTEQVWIDYWKKDESGKMPSMPETGYVKIIDTSNPDTRIYMDMSVPSLDRNLLWSRASPCCVSKFKHITRDEYLKVKQNSIISQIKKLEDQIASLKNQLKDFENDRT